MNLNHISYFKSIKGTLKDLLLVYYYYLKFFLYNSCQLSWLSMTCVGHKSSPMSTFDCFHIGNCHKLQHLKTYKTVKVFDHIYLFSNPHRAEVCDIWALCKQDGFFWLEFFVSLLIDFLLGKMFNAFSLI